MLKKLTPRHKDIIRRLIVAETPVEIAQELGMTPAAIYRLQNDPLFATELREMEQKANTSLISSEKRLDALESIRLGCDESAELVRKVVNDKVAGVPDIAIDLRVKSAWDLLDRGGHSKVEKSATVDLTQLILEAARQREGRNSGTGTG